MAVLEGKASRKILTVLYVARALGLRCLPQRCRGRDAEGGHMATITAGSVIDAHQLWLELTEWDARLGVIHAANLKLPNTSESETIAHELMELEESMKELRELIEQAENEAYLAEKRNAA